MKKSIVLASLVLTMFLAGCGEAMTISNVSAPGNAKSAKTSTIGKNSQLSYISDSSIEDACKTQVKLLTDAKWTEADPIENKGTYLKTTYTDGKGEIVLLCSTTEISATEKATKVTMTLMNSL